MNDPVTTGASNQFENVFVQRYAGIVTASYLRPLMHSYAVGHDELCRTSSW